MNNPFKKIAFALLMILTTSTVFSQENAPVEMASDLYQSGKIYVVVIVISIIFVGIAGYLIMLDRKISKLEKDSK